MGFHRSALIPQRTFKGFCDSKQLFSGSLAGHRDPTDLSPTLMPPVTLGSFQLVSSIRPVYSTYTSPRLGVRPDLPKRPQFGSAAASVSLIDRGIGWLVRKIYENEGVRYIFEGVAVMTGSRTVQQMNRTKKITGERNYVAAAETAATNILADLLDTILPGALALGIGWAWDRQKNTFVQYNMGQAPLAYYESVAKGAKTQADFLKQVETHLRSHAGVSDAHLALEQVVQKLHGATKKTLPSVMEAQLKTLADKLKLKTLMVSLGHGEKAVEMSLSELLTDLTRFHGSKALQGVSHYGDTLAKLLSKTQAYSHTQNLGNLVALASSIAIPFLVRMGTRKVYNGKDAFPGSKQLRDYFEVDHAQDNNAGQFKLFPYLQHCFEKGSWVAPALTGIFAAVLAASVFRRFDFKLANMTASNFFKVYGFQRSFPFTTVTQMELTYGLLCLVRMAGARDESEFRESTIRDAIMGWPTLTYFFPMLNKFMTHSMDKRLSKGQHSILTIPNGSVRAAEDVSKGIFPTLLKNSGITKNIEQTMVKAQVYRNRITIAAAALSAILLAWLEPQIGIFLTNKLEVARLRRERHELDEQKAKISAQELLRLRDANSAKPALLSPLFETQQAAFQGPRYPVNAMHPFHQQAFMPQYYAAAAR